MPSPLLRAFSKPAGDPAVTITRAEGVYVFGDDGRSYLDAVGSLWHCQVGHGRTEIVEAVSQQLRTLDVYNVFDPFTNEPAERAAARIVELSPCPDGRVFFCGSGSEAVDTALKLARLLPQRRGDLDRQVVIRRGRAYHGVNLGGTTAQGLAANREGWGDLVPHFVEVPPDDIEAVAAAFTEHAGRVAAFITEPVQGAAGVFPPPPGYLDALRRLCDDHGALLIFDEVITGFGRTGSWFASRTYDVTPDLMTFAKGVTSGYQPLGGVVLSRAVCEELEDDRDFVLRHGYTYSGHPASCAAALANLDIIERETLVERARTIGSRLSIGLTSLRDDGAVREVRGVGALWAVGLEDDSEAGAVRDRMRDRGVLTRSTPHGIAFCPPLIIEDVEIDRCVDALHESLR